MMRSRVSRSVRGGETSRVRPVSAATAEHYAWGDRCEGWRLSRHGTLGVTLERMPPGTREVPHFHERSVQFFYVLSGCLEVHLGPSAVRLRSREGVLVPPRVVHHVVSHARREAVFLVIATPSTTGDRTDV